MLLSVSARADVITTGIVTLTNPLGVQITVMRFEGDGFRVAARGESFAGGGSVPCMFGCSAGSTVSVSAQSGFWTFSDVSGSMNVNGTLFSFVFPSVPFFPYVAISRWYGKYGLVGGALRHRHRKHT